MFSMLNYFCSPKETVGTRSMKPTHSALALLWEVAHFPDLPRHLVERAFNEHLATLAEININVDAIRHNIYIEVGLNVMEAFTSNLGLLTHSLTALSA